MERGFQSALQHTGSEIRPVPAFHPPLLEPGTALLLNPWMPDARQQMIDAAVRMYGDDLEKIAGARRWLEELTEGADERKLTVAAEKFERADHALRPFTVRKVFLIAAAVVAVALTSWFVWVDHTDKGPLNPSSAPLSKNSLLTGLSPSERLLIGNSGEPRLLRSRKLWESDPSNPAYFAEYAVTFHRKTKLYRPAFPKQLRVLIPAMHGSTILPLR